MSVSSLLAITQLAQNQAQAYATVNEAVAALELAGNSFLDVVMSADKELSIAEMTRSVYFRVSGNSTPLTLKFPSRTVSPPQSNTPYTKRLAIIKNGGSATLTVSVAVSGSPTTITLTAGETAMVYVEASGSGGAVSKLFSSTGGGGGGGGGSVNLGVYAPGSLSVGALMRYVFATATTFSDNFAGAVGSVSANPTATQTLEIYKNATQIGTITISTSGIFTFTTSGSSSENFSVGDVLSVKVTTVAGGLTDFAATFKGTV